VDDRRVAAVRLASLDATALDTLLESRGADGAAMVTAFGVLLKSDVDDGDRSAPAEADPLVAGAALVAAMPQVLQ
jgi:hypothetical protein